MHGGCPLLPALPFAAAAFLAWPVGSFLPPVPLLLLLLLCLACLQCPVRVDHLPAKMGKTYRVYSKVWKTPRRCYEKERLDRELKLVGEYGQSRRPSTAPPACLPCRLRALCAPDSSLLLSAIAAQDAGSFYDARVA